jgi:2-polyprenyl-3-methyl-5-hydroxy-6-metoxy-1,4-benzoquinol methylase
MQQAEEFWDDHAVDYAKSPIKDLTAYHRTLDRTISYLTAEDELLEVGCGTGTTALALAPHVRHILATDISLKMILIARNRASVQGVENIRFEQMSLGETGRLPGPFDAVLAFNLLHLMEDPEAALTTLHAHLKPGGLLISKTVCLKEHSPLKLIALYLMQKLGKAPFVNRLSSERIDEMITAAGFEILETGAYPASPLSCFVVARKT